MPKSSDMAMLGKLGAFALHSRYDSRETSAPGRAAAEQRFLDEVDPNRELPEAERLRRAGYARKAHMARLALASARKRAAKKKRTAGGEPAAAGIATGGAGRGSDDQQVQSR